MCFAVSRPVEKVARSDHHHPAQARVACATAPQPATAKRQAPSWAKLGQAIQAHNSQLLHAKTKRWSKHMRCIRSHSHMISMRWSIDVHKTTDSERLNKWRSSPKWNRDRWKWAQAGVLVIFSTQSFRQLQMLRVLLLTCF